MPSQSLDPTRSKAIASGPALSEPRDTGGGGEEEFPGTLSIFRDQRGTTSRRRTFRKNGIVCDDYPRPTPAKAAMIGVVSVITLRGTVRCGKSRPVVSERRVGAPTFDNLSLKPRRPAGCPITSRIHSMPHLSGELFKRMAGIEMTHVPSRRRGTQGEQLGRQRAREIKNRSA